MLGLRPENIRVTELTEELLNFNKNVPQEQRLQIADYKKSDFDKSWKLPSKYLNLDVDGYVQAVFRERLIQLKYSCTQTELAITRVSSELQEYRARDLYNLLRSIIYVLNQFRATNQIYGVGRGSSCASYVLFLLGLHVVDSIKFNVPMEEFFHL